MSTQTFKFSISPPCLVISRSTLIKTIGLATIVVQGIVHAADSKDDWIQYPPRAAVKLTEQINKFRDAEVQKKEGEKEGEKEKRNEEKKDFEKKDLDARKADVAKSEKASPNDQAQAQAQAKETPKPKTLVSEDVSWEKDHKTKNTLKKFSDGTSEIQTDVIEPVAGEPSYKGNLEMIPMTYADGVKSIITRKAKSEEYEWGKDHTTKTTIYKFSDGTINVDIKSIPKKYSQPEFKDGFEKITITYGDGTQKTEEYEAIDRRVSWSKDHLTQKIKYVFEDGKSYEESVDVPKVLGTPVYEADQERITVTYGDGFKEEIINKAVDQKITWSSDHLVKNVTYLFADGGTSSLEVKVPRVEGNPTYKGNIQTLYFIYGDGTKTALSRKAIGERVTWSADHLTKTTEYSFVDGTINKVVSSVPQEVTKPVYEKNIQTITTRYGDGTVDTVVNKAISEDVSWSEDHLFRTITYKFSDGTSNQVVQSIPNQISPPSYSRGTETIKKVYGDGFEKIFTYDAISQKEVWSKDHESKVTIYKFADGTTHKEEIQLPKIYGQPTYDRDMEIIAVNYADGTTKIVRKKAVESKIILAEDDKTKLTRYIFEDGTVNDVPIKDLISMEKTPKDVILRDQPSAQNEQATVDKNISKKSAVKVEVHKPVYLQGLEIVTMTTSDGKTQTATYKAISKDEKWSKDGKTKFTTYRFEDGTSNTVTTDVMTQMSKLPKASSNQDNDELSSHSLADD